MEDENEKEYKTYFWNLLEKESSINVPSYIKNILRFNNFDNSLSFRHITANTIQELEEFFRDVMKDFLEPETDLQLFYGRYHKCPEKFQFMIGNKHLIGELVTFVKSKSCDF